MTQRTRAAAAAAFSSMSIQRFLGIAIGTLGLVSVLSAFARWAHTTVNEYPTKTEIDSAYVKKAEFQAYQQGEVLGHTRDSLINDAHWARNDTALGALVRDCRRRGGCQ